MKIWFRGFLCAGLMAMGTLTMAAAPSVSNQEVENYILMNTPYAGVVKIETDGINRKLWVQGKSSPIYLEVEWSDEFQSFYIDRWVEETPYTSSMSAQQ
ncbi:MAG: hypothetical protein H6585_00015 [Flavobacteriales bacterium]|nr:hypothetical protein [Flavobacteriales bacterium]